nr:AGE family epimerase/isomerase [Georgenia muralis]
MFPLDDLGHEARRLLAFGRAAALPGGGFAWLDVTGAPTPGMPAYLYVTGRMTHTYALAHLLGVPGAAELVDHGVNSLRTVFHDDAHGGWFTAVEAGGAADGLDGGADSTGHVVVDDRKWSYPHAFVILAAASAHLAGRPGAAELLDEALAVVEERFWDEGLGVVVEEWDASFTRLSDYRGANANMHTVEAFLAAFDATGRAVWLDRARQISERVVGVAEAHQWRLPEHYDAGFHPLLEHNREHLTDPFKPYGATVGHGFEWSRLLLQVDAGLHAAWDGDHGAADPMGSEPGTASTPSGRVDLVGAARALFDRAVADGWSVDGAPGFVYTTDWSGTPVIRQRLHWVVCEALGAAAALWHVTGEEAYAGHYRTWWEYARTTFVDTLGGSWHHELDPVNRPAATIRPGKADIYHATQAMLLPGLPLRPSMAGALVAG